jgi:hypothetical protein
LIEIEAENSRYEKLQQEIPLKIGTLVDTQDHILEQIL